MSIGREHQKVELGVFSDGLAPFTPAEMNEFFHLSAGFKQKFIEFHTIFGIEVDVSRRGVRNDFIRFAAGLFVVGEVSK